MLRTNEEEVYLLILQVIQNWTCSQGHFGAYFAATPQKVNQILEAIKPYLKEEGVDLAKSREPNT